MLPLSHTCIRFTPTAAPQQQQGPYVHKAGSSLRRASSVIRAQEDHALTKRLQIAGADSDRHQSFNRGSSSGISLDTTDEQQQLLRWEQQLLRRKWEQQFAGCSSWQDLRQSPAFLTEGLPGNSPATFMAAAAMLARLLKQQRGHALDKQRIQRQQDPEDVSQQQEDARHLWLWYCQTVLYGCINQRPPAGSGSSGVAGETVDTVTAAALLQATAAMGWTSEQLHTLTGIDDARRSLASPCLALFEAGISTAMADSSSSSSSSSHQVSGDSLSNSDATSNLRLNCPPIAVINLVTALQALGIRSRADVKQTRDQALIAALSTSFSTHSSNSSNSSNWQWPRLGFPAVLKLLQGFVLKGELMCADVMDATVQAVQAHITSHPHRLLPLLQYMISLQKCKLWHEGRQTLLLFKVQLLVGLRQLPERGWPRMMEGLRYQCVLQLLGPKYVDSNNSTPGVNSSSSSSNAPGRQFSRSKGTGSASASSAASLHSSESSGVVGRMTGKELEQLLKQRLPRVQCSFKELVDLSDCIAQLPPHTDLFVLKKLLLAAGLQVLSRSAAAAAAEPRPGRSQRQNSSVLEPREISSWMSHTALQRAYLNARQRKQLAGLLLDVLGSGSATPAQLAAPEGAATSSRGRSRSGSGDPSFDSNPSSRRGSSSNSSGSSIGGGWVPNTLVPLLVAACDLQLPFAAGPEWWPTVMQLVLQHEHLQLLKPDQALLILQCMARSKHRPSHPEVAQLLQVISNRWFPAADASLAAAGDNPQASATSSSSRGSTRGGRQGSRPRQPELGQLVDLLCVLASLKHRPQLRGGSRVGWWIGYQAALMQVAEPPPPQQQQQQQQQDLLRPDLLAGLSSSQQSWLSQLQQPTHQLDAVAAVKVIWAAGRLGLSPEPQLLLILLQHLQGNLERVELKQLVGVIVGLSTVLREHSGVLSRRAYIRLCEALLRAGEPSLQDATNLLNCFGSIAATTDATGSADAALDAEVAAHVGPEQQQQPRQQSAARQPGQQMVGGKQRQRQLRPPPHVVEWLLAAVEPRLQEISSTGLAMMLWGLRKLNHKPSKQWLNRYQQVVLERAGGTPRLPDYQCAIVVASLVHLGVALDTALLQELLFRVPRNNISPGLMADLTAALKKLEEPLDPMHWQQEAGKQQVQQQEQQPAQGAGIQSFEDLELDLDALIDSARAELGRFGHSGQQQEEHQDQEVVGSLAAVSAAGGAEGPGGADEAVIDPAAVKRIRSHLAVFEELLRDSS